MTERLWYPASRCLRVASCRKRWDIVEGPCKVVGEQTLPFYLQSPADGATDECQTLGQFLNASYLSAAAARSQCPNARCRDAIFKHEQCFSCHGGSLLVRAIQLTPEQALPEGELFVLYTLYFIKYKV